MLRWIHRSVSTLLCIVAMILPVEAQPVEFDFLPSTPLSTDWVHAKVTYTSSCFLYSDSEIEGSTIRILAQEGCACPPVLPYPLEFVESLAPFAPGDYQVELWRVPSPREPGCHFDPLLLGTGSLSVDPSFWQVELIPPEPQAGSYFQIKFRTRCQISVDGPYVEGRVLRFIEEEPPILPPVCSEDFVNQWYVGIDPLEEGEYSILYAGPEIDDLLFQQAFRVHSTHPIGLELGEGRFRITAQWTTPEGETGDARSQSLTPNSGAFWFFDEENLELFAKVLDGCALNGHHWLLVGGITDLDIELSVEDRTSDLIRKYRNPDGRPFAPIIDLRASPCL